MDRNWIGRFSPFDCLVDGGVEIPAQTRQAGGSGRGPSLEVVSARESNDKVGGATREEVGRRSFVKESDVAMIEILQVVRQHDAEVELNQLETVSTGTVPSFESLGEIFIIHH